jgi:hypothetical protein
MPVLVELPTGASLQADNAGSLHLPPVTFRNEGQTQPFVFGTRVLRLSGTPHPLRQSMEMAYRTVLDKDLRQSGVRLIRAETCKPPALPLADPRSLQGAAFHLELEMEFAEALPSGRPDQHRVQSFVLELPVHAGPPEPCEVAVTPEELTVVEGGKQAHLTIRVRRLPPGVQPRIVLDPPGDIDPGLQAGLKQGLLWSVTRLGGPEGDGVVAFRATTALHLTQTDKQTLAELTRTRPLVLPARTIVDGQVVPHRVKLATQEKTFPGWLAIDFGTSSSSVTVYDNRKNTSLPGLPAEQEAELKRQMEAVLTAPPAEVEPEAWKTFLEELGRKLPGVGSLHEAVLHGDEAVRYQVLRQLEIQLATLADEGLRNHLNNWLYELYHEALRVPPLSKLSLHPIELEGAGGETEIPSELRIDRLEDPLVVTMGRKVQRDREERLRQGGAGADVPLQFLHSPKRYVGQDREIQVGVGGERQNLPIGKLVQAAWGQLIKLTDAYRTRARDRFTPGQMRHAIITYPTVSPPFVRREIERLVLGLGMSTVQTEYDEAVSAAIFYLMREVGGIPELGMESFKARCRTDGRRWWRNVLVLDVGGGSTDVALIRLALEEETPFAPGEDVGAGGRYYRIVPELMGSTGHLQLGGELVTLRTFELLKTAIADRLLTAVSHPREDTPLPLAEQSPLHQHLLGIVSTLSERFRDSEDRFASGSLLLHVLNRPTDGLDDGRSREALDIANQVLPTRWATDPAALESFYDLWEQAEAAKIQLGRTPAPGAAGGTFSLTWPQVQKLLRLPAGTGEPGTQARSASDGNRQATGGTVPVATPEFTVTIDRKQFERAVGPVVREAVHIARGLVKSRLEDKPGERLDWLILSGKTCYLDLIHREVRRLSGTPADAAWAPRQITFVPRYAKLATSVGACYAEYLRQYRFNPEGARQLLRKGFHQLHFDIHNLFFYLPCSFVREVVGGFETIFKAGDPMYQLDEEPIGKVRSPWTRPSLTTGIHRQDFPLGPKIKWGSFSAAELVKTLGITDTRFLHEYKIQFEVNQRLQFELLLCQGTPHYHIRDKLPTLSIRLTAEKAGAQEQGRKEDGEIPLTPSSHLGCDIAVRLGATEEVVFRKGTELSETFHADDGTTRRGLVSGPLPAFPAGGRHTLLVRHGGDWVSLGEYARPASDADYPCQYRFSLDEQGALRLHAEEVPYWETDHAAGLADVGRVFRMELELFPTDVDVMRDPFSGVH